MLSVVLPVRCDADNAYRLDRLAANLTLFAAYDGVECIVVDSASTPRHAERIRELCRGRPRCRLVADPEPQQPFAPGSTRNVGSLQASGEFLLFYDVDLCCDAGFVPAVEQWTASSRGPCDFLVVPCLFLTREGSERVTFTGAPVELDAFRSSLLAGEDHLVAHFAATHVVVSRTHFLRIGGFRPEYRGHGCEDFDLLHRLCSYQPCGRRPQDYYLDAKRRLPGDYRGFRAYQARYALPLLFDGLYTAHLWHPRPLHRTYFRRRDANEALLQRSMREHDGGMATAVPLVSPGEAGGTPPPPLPAPWRDGDDRTLPELAELIRTLAVRHGYGAAAWQGLVESGQTTRTRSGTAAAKLRKLVLHPREFLSDSRFATLRAIGRLFPPAPRD